MQKKRPSGFLAGLRKPIDRSNAKPKKRKVDPEKLEGKQVWQSRRKKGRLVVRNLPFKVTEEKLKEHFQKYGNVVETVLLKRKDGKLVGCGFVEFEKREDAKNALEECSGKPLMNRPIVVDWAVPKNTFKHTQKKSETEVKEEAISSDEDDVKPSIADATVKEESSDSDEEDSDDEREEEEAESDADSEDAEDRSAEDEEDQEEDEEEKAKQKRLDDLDEGKTVFLKCVPFTATEEDLRECLNKFGPIAYALICIDRVTEHSRGTAFVKFKNKESADKCLSAGASDLRIGTGVLDPHKALNKKQLNQKSDDKKEDLKKKDGRNLYLIKEGVVLAGSAAAKGVSAEDMAYRLQLEQSKSQMLRNLSMVISPCRLAVHNLPENYSDQSLRNVFKKHSPEGSKITEARIMRDLRKVDSTGQGLSRGYGFVTFTRHEDALAALRAINNNPNIFAQKKRPIVSFSIENKALLNARQKRQEVSKNKNPTFAGRAKGSWQKEAPAKHEESRGMKSVSEGNFGGIEAHRKQKIKLPTKRTLNAQADLHRKTISTEKKKVKRLTEIKKQKKDKARKKMELKPVSRTKGEKGDKSFDVMVNKYKSMVSNKDIKKWYE